MRTLTEIEDRVRALVEEELRRRLDRPVLPSLCEHNHTQPLDYRKTIFGEDNPRYNRVSSGSEMDDESFEVKGNPVDQRVQLCMLNADKPDEWGGSICEDPVDAQRCPYFEYRVSREAVYKEFVENLESTEWLEANLPAVYALLWVIGGKGVSVGRPLRWWEVLWAKILSGPLRNFPKSSARISVYLPPLDAIPSENPAGTTASS